MRNRRPFTFTLGALVAASLVLTGCSASGGSPDGGGGGDPSVSVQLKTLSSPYWLQVKAGAEAGGAETGATVTLAGATAETEVQQQIDKIRTAITQQVDAIVVAATAPDQIKPVLEEAAAAGIKVLLVDTPVDGFEDAVTFIGTDNLAAGEQAGEFIASQTTSGKMAILGGHPGNGATDDRVQGVKDALAETDIEIVAELTAESDRALARSTMADILQTSPDINVVFAANDDMALGAVEALKAAGVDLSKVTVVGADGTADAVESVLAGELTASIAQNSYDMGKVGVEQAVKAVAGDSVEKRIDTGTTLVDIENAQEYLDLINSR